MKFNVGDLVESTHGKDKGQLFLIYNTTEKCAFLVNGSNRTKNKPKIKNFKHIKLKKSLKLDFNYLNNCDIIYKIRCFMCDSKINVEDN